MHNVRATKDWYFVQAFYKGSGYKCFRTIVFADSKSQAKSKIASWLERNNAELSLLMKNNYVRDAESMVASGNYIS